MNKYIYKYDNNLFYLDIHNKQTTKYKFENRINLIIIK